MNWNRPLLICSLILCLAWGSSVSQAADSWSYPTSKPSNPFGGGDGSSYDPYRIETAQHLANLAYMVTDDNTEYKGKYFVLTNDITLNDDVINDAGTGLKYAESSYNLWTPIGEYGITYDDDFMGYFDGQGHTIRGMVCIDNEGQRDYNGLFGSVDEATIKNLNLEDCYLFAKEVDSDSYRYGTLIGNSWNSRFINCHVSKSVVDVTFIPYNRNDVFVGGMIGCCDFAQGRNKLMFTAKTHMANCSFKGNIYVKSIQVAQHSCMHAGGLIGYQLPKSDVKLYLADCYTEGEIYMTSTETLSYLYLGGILSEFTIGETEIKNCVSRMNITVDTNHGLYDCYISGLGYTKNKLTNDKFKVSQCVSFGTIKIGDNAQKVKIIRLFLNGLLGNIIYNDEGVNLRNCAFYGKFDIHCRGDYALITSLCDRLVENNSPSVVYSVGNVIDINYDETDLDKVCFKAYSLDEDDDLIESKHHCYYHFANTGNVTFPCNGTADASKYNKTLAEMKTDDFIKTLNTAAGSNMWGKLTGMSDASLNGLPMPVACGGVLSDYTGDGMSESSAYIIKTEDDIKRLMESVNNGSTFEGKYFKLGSDIRITGTLDESIGSYEKPFKGHLDGCGHAIIGLRKSLFGYMYGTVKNLALLDCNIWDGNYATALARSVGDEYNKAEVSNCYVSGTISFSTPWDQLGYASSFAFQLAKGSSIHDCYFKGRFVVKEQTFNTYNVAGIAIHDTNRTVNTSAESPEGIFNCYASFDVKVEASELETRYTYGISSESLNDESKGNYFVCSDYRVHQYYNGGIKLNSESELNEKFAGKAGWLQGVYRPLLASAKHYEATSPEGTTAYFDAIPEANPKKNYFYNISIDDPYSDVSLWNLPNMAVYVPSEQKDYITNGYLDQSSDFQYKRNAGATATAGQLRYDLTQNVTGYHMICLPGIVERSDLPKDSKVMIVGKIQALGETELVNVVMVDTIPAGVPCMLYVPTSSVAKDEKISLVMRSGIVSEPIMNEAYSDFKGTFSKKNDLTVWTCTTVKINDKNKQPYFDRNTTAPVTVLPFTAWLANANRVVQIVDYILLDEENSAMTVTLANWNEQTINLKMRRTVKGGKWNTICLPFDMTAEEIAATFGEGTLLETFGGLTYDSSTETTTLEFSEATSITAGTPYLLKPGKVSNVSIFDIKSKEIKCESADYVPEGTKQDAITAEGTISLAMQGEYNKRIIDSNDYTQMYMYIISGDKIYYVDSEVELKGFRCYFVAEETSGTSGAAKLFSGARLMHFDGSSTDLRLIKADSVGEGSAVYDLLGRKSNGQRKGVSIKNGKKVLKN